MATRLQGKKWPCEIGSISNILLVRPV